MSERVVRRHVCQKIYFIELYLDVVIAYETDYSKGGRAFCDCGYPLFDIDYFELPELVEPMERQQAIRTSQNMACSNCWGVAFTLTPVEMEEGEPVSDLVLCAHCKHNTRGYVTRRWVTRCQDNDLHNYMTARKGLREVLGIKRDKLSEKDTLSALGF